MKYNISFLTDPNDVVLFLPFYLYFVLLRSYAVDCAKAGRHPGVCIRLDRVRECSLRVQHIFRHERFSHAC